MDILLFLGLMVVGTFFLGVSDITQKKYLRDGIDEQLLLAASWILGGIALAAVLVFTGVPDLKPEFWQAFPVSIALNLALQNFFIRALKVSEASLLAPLRLLMPPLVIVTGFFILGEKPASGGIVGIVITIAGLWFLLSSGSGVSLKKTFAGIRSQRGLLLGIASVFISAVSFAFDKKAILASSGIFFSSSALFIVGALTLLGNVLFRPHFRASLSDHLDLWRKPLIFVSLIGAAGTFLTNQALNYSLAAYAANLKRLWSFWTVLLAGRFLGEREFGRRLLATVIMLLGIAIMVIWG